MIRAAAILLVFVVSAGVPAVVDSQGRHAARSPAPPAAKEAADQYFRLNLDGARLTSEGCTEIDKLRVGSPARVPGSIYVIEKVNLSRAVLTGPGAAVVDVWYSEVGTLDVATCAFRSPTPGLLTRGDCELRQVGERWMWAIA